MKNEDLRKLEHKIPICGEDKKKLYQSKAFNDRKSKSSQYRVFFNVMLFLCPLGGEIWTEEDRVCYQSKVK